MESNETGHRQLVFNYARVSIDKVTSFLMQELNFACHPIESEATSTPGLPGQQAPVARWKTEIDTAILGDDCYEVTWDAEERRIRVTASMFQASSPGG